MQELAQIDREVNPSCWKLKSYTDAYSNNSQHILGIFTIDQQLIGGLVYSVSFETAEILQLCITSRYQQTGKALQLLDYLLKHLASIKVTQIFLEVRHNNQAAINLYDKLGFNTINTRINYYKINGKFHDALLMAKTL